MSVNFFGSNCTPAEKKKAGPVNNIGTGVEEMRTVVSSQPLALGPCFCVRSFGLDVYLESGRDVGVELDRDFELPGRLDGLVELDLVAIHGQPVICGRDGLCQIDGRDRTKCFSALAGGKLQV